MLSSIFITTFAIADFSYHNETEVGQTSVGGNAKAVSANLKQTSTFILGQEKFIVNGSYQYAESANVVIVRNWSVSTRIDHTTEKKLDTFVGLQSSGNKFSGFYERFDVDLGLKHYLTKPKTETDKNLFYVELGARWSKENRKKPANNFNDEIIQGRFFIEFQKQINQNFYTDFSLENIGNLEHPGRYRGIFMASVNSIMTQYLTLKVSYQVNYDDYLSNEGFKRLDYTYTTSILANF